MKRWILYIFLLVVFLIETGCKDISSTLFILIDISGSPTESAFESWKGNIRKKIDKFKNGKICIIPIRERYPNPMECICEDIQGVYPPPPFPENGQKIRLLEYVENLQQIAHHTDIKSSVFYALNILANESFPNPKYLYIYSDFLQTVPVDPHNEPNAQGVKLEMIFGAPRDTYLGGRYVIDIYKEVKQSWEENFRRWRAESVMMIMIEPNTSELGTQNVKPNKQQHDKP